MGEDLAAFRLSDQRVMYLAYFSGITAVVLYGLNMRWIDPASGFGTSFLNAPSPTATRCVHLHDSLLVLTVYAPFINPDLVPAPN